VTGVGHRPGPTAGTGGPFLEASGLTVNFGGVRALDQVSLAIEPRAISSLIGPNGAGKTTAFNVVTGFLRPDAGQVAFRGERLSGLRPYQIARRGVVRTFQQARVFAGVSVLESVLMGGYLQAGYGLWRALLHDRAMRRGEAELLRQAREILDFLGLHRPDELAGRLPYGERKLLEIAIALAARPAVLLLDEPAAGMNPEERRRLTGILQRVVERGVTILLVEHDMHLVMDISRTVVVLNFGRKIAEGSPREIVKNPEVVRAYLGEDARSFA
jgi:branched-chain amino acid transport system ATP-binding protein